MYGGGQWNASRFNTMVKYWYRLRREAKAHPLKAVVLAGMCVAALYYWVPIVKRWTAGRPPQNVALQPAVRRAVVGPAASTPENTTTLEWKALVAEERHPAWKPVSVSTTLNPFRPLDAEPADAVAREPESEPLPNVVVDPQRSTVAHTRSETLWSLPIRHRRTRRHTGWSRSPPIMSCSKPTIDNSISKSRFDIRTARRLVARRHAARIRNV